MKRSEKLLWREICSISDTSNHSTGEIWIKCSSLFCSLNLKKIQFRSYIDNPGPMVVFATPGMLHAGLSLNIFRRWCSDENNMIIMPGYLSCVNANLSPQSLPITMFNNSVNEWVGGNFSHS